MRERQIGASLLSSQASPTESGSPGGAAVQCSVCIGPGPGRAPVLSVCTGGKQGRGRAGQGREQLTACVAKKTKRIDTVHSEASRKSCAESYTRSSAHTGWLKGHWKRHGMHNMLIAFSIFKVQRRRRETGLVANDLNESSRLYCRHQYGLSDTRGCNYCGQLKRADGTEPSEGVHSVRGGRRGPARSCAV